MSMTQLPAESHDAGRGREACAGSDTRANRADNDRSARATGGPRAARGFLSTLAPPGDTRTILSPGPGLMSEDPRDVGDAACVSNGGDSAGHGSHVLASVDGGRRVRGGAGEHVEQDMALFSSVAYQPPDLLVLLLSLSPSLSLLSLSLPQSMPSACPSVSLFARTPPPRFALSLFD